MFKNERQREIYDILNTQGFVTVKTLSEQLYTSESSIRRDLSDMESMGLVKRSYGGASIITSHTSVLPFQMRSYNAVEEKRQIAAKASELIKEGDIIFLDQSSTSYFLALTLLNYNSLTVITNNIEILSVLSHTQNTVLSTGGMISKRNTNCLIGNNAQKAFEGVYADLAFFSAKALSADGIISDCTQEETFVRNAMLKNATKRVFLCDSTKMNTHSAYVQCTLADIDVLISDSEQADQYKKEYPNLTVI